MAYDSLPKSRREAKAQGAPRYFTGKPCKNGHVAERYVFGGCVPCHQAFSWARRQDPEVLDQQRSAQRWRMRRKRADPVEAAKIKLITAASQKKHWRKGRAKFLSRLAGEPKPERCQICDKRGRVCFDHCHATGKFRGWICNQCNTILGWVNDDPIRLRKLAAYLEKSLNDREPLPTYLRPELKGNADVFVPAADESCDFGKSVSRSGDTG